MFLAVCFQAAECRGEEITIVAVGDLYLGGSAEQCLVKNGFDHPFERTRDILRRADVALANLEGPLTTSTSPFVAKQFLLKQPVESAAAIGRAGFDLVTLANNHIMDYGRKGLTDTVALLDRFGVRHAGAGEGLDEARRAVFINIKGKRIAFLAYSLIYPKEFFAGKSSPGTAPGYAYYVKADVEAARKESDLVVVSFHWGDELSKRPKGYQKTLARLAIDSGAGLVLGHHPHVNQEMERYKGGLIFYSLGNFAFGSLCRSGSEGMMAVVAYRNGGVLSGEAVNLNVNNREVRFQPAPIHSPRISSQQAMNSAITMNSIAE